jgi:hypothetical protein
MTPTTTKRKRRAELRWTAGSVLSVYLVAWLALIPLLQMFHLAFADHDHRFCERHHQIEDVPRRNPAEPWRPNEITAGESAWSKRSPHAMLLHVACAVLNQGTFRDPAVPSGSPLIAVQSDRSPGFVTSVQVVLRACPLLLTAPKTSPPFAAV